MKFRNRCNRVLEDGLRVAGGGDYLTWSSTDGPGPLLILAVGYVEGDDALVFETL